MNSTIIIKHISGSKKVIFEKTKSKIKFKYQILNLPASKTRTNPIKDTQLTQLTSFPSPHPLPITHLKEPPRPITPWPLHHLTTHAQRRIPAGPVLHIQTLRRAQPRYPLCEEPQAGDLLDEAVAAAVVDLDDFAHCEGRLVVCCGRRICDDRVGSYLFSLLNFLTYLVGVLFSCCANVIVKWFLENGNGGKKRPYLYTSPPKTFRSETIANVL